MLYLVAILLPPLAVLLCGKPVQFVLNLVLTLCLWVPGVVHAILVVADSKARKRNDRIVAAIEGARP